jgi:hypothetical protein
MVVISILIKWSLDDSVVKIFDVAIPIFLVRYDIIEDSGIPWCSYKIYWRCSISMF